MNSLHIAWLMIRRTLGRKMGFITFLLLPCLVVTGAVALLGVSRVHGRSFPMSTRIQG